MLKKPREIEIIAKNPFLNDKLERRPIIENLTQIIKNAEEGFVLGVNSPWGTGKTTFIRMWDQHLQNEGFKTIYFNAWEHDFSKEPLLSLLSVINKGLPSNDAEQFKTLKKFGLGIIKAGMPIAIRAMTAGILNSEDFKDLFSGSTDADIVSKMGKIVDDKLQNLTAEQGIQEGFRDALSVYVNEFVSEGADKIIFFIDELDRCRPTYAVELLEAIKHFFSVENIVFVFVVAKDQLGCSISTMYGHGMDTEGYLKKFIDISFNLIKPSRDNYIEHLALIYDIENILTSRLSGEFNKEINIYIDSIKFLVETYKLDMREIDHLFIHLLTTLNMTQANIHFHPVFLIFLLVLKIKVPNIYYGFVNNEVDAQKIMEDFEQKHKETHENKWLKPNLEAFIRYYGKGRVSEAGEGWAKNFMKSTKNGNINAYTQILLNRVDTLLRLNDFNIKNYLSSKIEFCENFDWSNSPMTK